MCFITSTYLNVYNSWIIFSVSQSFQAHVPWEKCPLMKNSSDFGEEEKGKISWKGILKRRKEQGGTRKRKIRGKIT
jgi:hypothetical protein